MGSCQQVSEPPSQSALGLGSAVRSGQASEALGHLRGVVLRSRDVLEVRVLHRVRGADALGRVEAEEEREEVQPVRLLGKPLRPHHPSGAIPKVREHRFTWLRL